MANTHCKVKNGAKGKAVAHANYISALGKYQAKEGEVVLLLHGNMPSFAVENPTDFWVASDEFGQASYMAIHKRKADGHQIIDGVKTAFKKGDPYEKTFHSRAYKEIEFSVPREIADMDKQKQFAREFALSIAGKTQPFTLAVHHTIAADGLPNVHAHLMLSEKMIDGVDREREMFFKKPSMPYRHRVTKELIPADPAKGGAAKNRAMHEIDFVKGVRESYQALAKSHGVDLDMRSNKEQWLGEPEPKLGPMHNRSKDNLGREARQETINRIREQRKENEHSSTASVNRIGVNIQSTSRYGEIANRPFKGAGENQQGIDQQHRSIAENVQAAGRASQFSKPDFSSIDQHHRGIADNVEASKQHILPAIELARADDRNFKRVAEATSQYKHLKAAGGIALSAGQAIGGIIAQITRATSRIEASLEVQAKAQAQEAARAAQAVIETPEQRARRRGRERDLKEKNENDQAAIKLTETPQEAISEVEAVQSTTLHKKTLTERVSESLEAILNWVKGNGKGDGALREINLERSDYTGRIVQIDNHHAVQDLGRSSSIHELARLDVKPRLDSMVNIKYKDGQGVVTELEVNGIGR